MKEIRHKGWHTSWFHLYEILPIFCQKGKTLVIEADCQEPGAGDWPQRDRGDSGGAREMLVICIIKVVLGLDKCVKTPWTVHWKLVNFVIYKLYLDKKNRYD